MDVGNWMTSYEARVAYVDKARRDFDPEREWTPISGYEPCEMGCGIHVVGMRLGPERKVVELVGVQQSRFPDRGLVMRMRGHQCLGRAL